MADFDRRKKRGKTKILEQDDSDEMTDESEEMEKEIPVSKKSKRKGAEKEKELGGLQEELSTLPLGELLSLKDHMPAKLYKKVVFNRTNVDSVELSKKDKEKESESDGEEPEEVEAAGESSSKPTRNFKRDNPKRPREMSAKKPVSVTREIFVTKKRVTRDPRFDQASGEFSSHVFRREYAFLDDLKKEEYQALRKEMKEETDSKRLEKLRFLKQRMDNQRRTLKEEDRKKDLRREVRVANMDRLKKGKDPFFVKKSEMKRRLQDDRFERLEKEGKLKKYQERREKKIAKKDRMPKF